MILGRDVVSITQGADLTVLGRSFGVFSDGAEDLREDLDDGYAGATLGKAIKEKLMGGVFSVNRPQDSQTEEGG